MADIVAVEAEGATLARCGRCRELIRQVDSANWETLVILPGNALARLGDLLPHSQRSSPSMVAAT